MDGQQPLASLLFGSNTMVVDICCTYRLAFQTRFPSLHLCGSRFKVTAEFHDSLLEPTTMELHGWHPKTSQADVTQVLGLWRCEVNGFATGVFDKFWAAEPSVTSVVHRFHAMNSGMGLKIPKFVALSAKAPASFAQRAPGATVDGSEIQQALVRDETLYLHQYINSRAKGDSSCEPVGSDYMSESSTA